MEEIDKKLKEIEDLNNRNYEIDEDFLELYSDIFDKYDEEIVAAPFVEYSEDNLPPYYPENGIWFNKEDVAQKFKEEELQELKELEEEKKEERKSVSRRSTIHKK